MQEQEVNLILRRRVTLPRTCPLRVWLVWDSGMEPESNPRVLRYYSPIGVTPVALRLSSLTDYVLNPSTSTEKMYQGVSKWSVWVGEPKSPVKVRRDQRTKGPLQVVLRIPKGGLNFSTMFRETVLFPKMGRYTRDEGDHLSPEYSGILPLKLGIIIHSPRWQQDRDLRLKSVPTCRKRDDLTYFPSSEWRDIKGNGER